MIRKFLRKHPILYTVVRDVHVLLNNISNFYDRYKLGVHYKSLLANIDKEIPKILYFCVPLHNNLGDYAQYVCIKKWLKESYPDKDIIEIPSCVIGHDYVHYFDAFKQIVNNKDLIVFQSGYTSTDLHVDEFVHRIIVREYPNNRIVFFPQTVKYSSEKEALKTADIYNKHKHLLFMARDNKSYDIAIKYFDKVLVQKMPDIVTTLIGVKTYSAERKGIFFCIRHDSEKKYTDAQVKTIFWELMSEDDTWGDTTLSKEVICTLSIIEDTLEQFSSHKLIITDRFHGTIFAMITSTPVVVLPTVDHKVTEGAEWFLKRYPTNIYLASNLEDALTRAKIMINEKDTKIDTPYYKREYYDTLVQIINQL